MVVAEGEAPREREPVEEADTLELPLRVEEGVAVGVGLLVAVSDAVGVPEGDCGGVPLPL